MYMSHALRRAQQQYPDRVATLYKNETLSFNELAQLVKHLSCVLHTQGIKPGDRVAILALNSPYYVAFFLACWWLGAVAVPLNTRWSTHELDYAIEQTAARMLWVDHALLDSALALQTLPTLIPIYIGSNSSPLGFLRLEELLKNSTAREANHLNQDALAAIIFTGGTTGKSKGVMLTQLNFWAAAVGRLATIPNRPTTMFSLLVAPLFHVAGLGRLISQIITASPTLLHDRFDAKEVLQDLHTHRIDDIVVVPTMLQALSTQPEFNATYLPNLKRIVWGAAAMPPPLLKLAMQALPHVEFINAYGMTESTASGTVNGPYTLRDLEQNNPHIFTAGRSIAASDVSIISFSGQAAQIGEIGEIVLRGPGVMTGYWQDPHATQTVIKNGWYHTGDAGYLDEFGYLHLTDRIKDMIITGGENVYSLEVENVLRMHPSIEQCAVIGLPCPVWGEIVHAVIVSHTHIDNDELNYFCRQHLAAYKCPKHYHFMQQLPLSAAGKILKTELKQLLRT